MSRPRTERRFPIPYSWMGPELGRVLASGSTWGFGFACFFLLPKYLATDMGAGPVGIGFVMGIFGIASFALTPLAGRVVDSWPHPRAFAAGSLLLAGSAIGFAFVGDLAGMALLRIVQAAAHALVFTALGAAVAELAPENRMSEAFGLAGASMLVMNAVAPAVVEPVVTWFGWNALFVVAISGAGVSFVLSRSMIVIPQPPREEGDDGGLMSVLRRPLTRHFAIVIFAVGIVFGTLFAFQQPYALEAGRTEVRGFFVAFASAALFVRLFFGGLPDRLGRHRVATVSLSVYALTALAFGFVPASWFEAFGALFGLAHGLFFPALNANVLSRTPRAERGRLMAIFGGSFNLGVATTTLLGLVAEVAGYPFVFAVTGISTALAAVLLAVSTELREPVGQRVADPAPLRAAAGR